MLYMLINATRKDLTPEQYAELGKMAQSFYDDVPDGLRLLGDWAAEDRSRTFALIEADEERLLDEVMRPFDGLVDIEVVPVTAIAGWGKA
jgi:hypothetical protein